jgi:hypothetical protein
MSPQNYVTTNYATLAGTATRMIALLCLLDPTMDYADSFDNTDVQVSILLLSGTFASTL